MQIGLGTLLAIIFTVLKLCNLIFWSWVWVLCPVWIPLAFALVVFILASVVAVIANTATRKRRGF